MPYSIEDADLGQVVIHMHARAQRIIARKKEDQVHLTVPLYCKEKDIRKALTDLKPKLLQLQTVPKRPIDESFQLHTFSFDVKISRNQLSKIYLQLTDGLLYITIPQTVDLYQPEIQQQLRGLIESALRYEAKRILPDYVDRLAKQHGFCFGDVKINKSCSRWGSCNMKKGINLSYFCLLLPKSLLELILLHELCHTVEMNHSAHFWQRLDAVTGGRAKELTKELKNFSTSI